MSSEGAALLKLTALFLLPAVGNFCVHIKLGNVCILLRYCSDSRSDMPMKVGYSNLSILLLLHVCVFIIYDILDLPKFGNQLLTSDREFATGILKPKSTNS